MFDGARPDELVESGPPRITLRNAFAHPFDSAIAAARTCYAPRLIGPEEITDKQRLNIGAATVEGGGPDVEALLVGDLFGSDQARGVAGAGGGNGGIDRVSEGVAAR